MPKINPYSPPTADVEDRLLDTEEHIDDLPVSEVWKKKFKAMRKAGGPGMKNLNSLSKAERKDLGSFNVVAFLFGPFYYMAKGMWRRGILLFAVCVAAVIVIDIALGLIGLEKFGKALGYGVAGVFAVRANADYYKKMVLGDNGWW